MMKFINQTTKTNMCIMKDLPLSLVYHRIDIFLLIEIYIGPTIFVHV